MSISRTPSPRRWTAIAASGVAMLLLSCESPMDRLDRQIGTVLTQSGASISELQPLPDESVIRGAAQSEASRAKVEEWGEEQPPTVNPDAAEITFVPDDRRDAEEVIARLEAYSEIRDDAVHLDMPGALQYATQNSREYRFAQEEYVLAALRLLIERHLWGPRFFDTMAATVTAEGDDGLYDSSLSLVNEFTVTQRLPYGGQVSATALARAVEDLHQRVQGENVQDAEIILAAEIPLLRGAGLAARETRIQRERDVIYAARSFARFRREFLFDIAQDYLSLVLGIQRIENNGLEVESLEAVEVQQNALHRAGRSTPFDADEAKNRTLEAIDRLDSAREIYRLAVDRFKVRLGMPVETMLVIEPDRLDLPIPKVGIDDAVYAAMAYRLDLQTERDRVVDSRRQIEVARNNLLGDLDIGVSASIPTDPQRDRSGLRFDPGYSEFEAGITYGLPLDREIERINLRQSQIALARSLRAYSRFRDDIAVNVRAAVRAIDSALFSLEIQERNVLIAQNREASIAADPDRADIRQKTDAIDATLEARNGRDGARRDLEVAVLGYLLATGQLRVRPSGEIEPLAGMDLPERDAAAPAPTGGAGDVGAS